MTDDCPVGLRRIRNACKLVYRVAASFFVMLVSLPGAIAQQAQGQAKSENSVSGSSSSSGKSSPAQVTNSRRFWEGEPPSKPAPPGFKYQGNPAGGGMILVKDPKSPVGNTTPDPLNTVPAMPGAPMIMHVVTPAPGKSTAQPDACTTPDLIIKKKTEQKVISKTRKVGSHQATSIQTETVTSESHANIDRRAQEFFEKGVSASKSGNKQMAGFYYEKALDAFDNQKGGDQRFRAELVRAIESCK